MRKPGALPGATALVQARAAKVFTAEHDAFWAAARKAHGDAAAPGHSSRCCCCTATWTRADVLAGITAALSVGSTNPDVVAVEARKAAERRGSRPRRRTRRRGRPGGGPGRASLRRAAR